jgi:cbb3-type cytochrome oxidase subunit 1
MMAVIYATLSAALLAGWFGRRVVAVGLIAVTLLLAVHLFLWEVHSPVYGYRLPWIQT